jgi:hypothetical protein
MDRPSDPIVPPDTARRSDAFRHRWRRGIVVGGSVGVAIGLVAGVTIGAFVGGGIAFWMSLLACVVAGAAIGMFVGGLSRLESPQPGREPSEVERPVLDEPALTKSEDDPSDRR